MAVDNYTFPGNVNVYVPSLSTDLAINYIRNPSKFAINKYVHVRKVDKMKGFYLKFQNAAQARVVSQDDHVWIDASDRPQNTQGGDLHEFPQYNCQRRAYVDHVGHLAVEQAGWDVLGRKSAEQTMKGMTARSLRVASTLTTPGNYPSANVLNASTAGGATWGNATTATPSIRRTVQKAANIIQQNTLGVLMMKELWLVINPNTAQTVSLSGEFLDFCKQAPDSLALWRGSEQFEMYNVPNTLFGVSVCVDDTVYVSSIAGPSVATVRAYTIPDNVALMVAKQQDIQPDFGPAFSSYVVFAYSDFGVSVYNDLKNKRYDLLVEENTDTETFPAPESAVLISTNS